MVVGGVEGLGDLLGHDVLLADDLDGIERGTEDQIRHHLHGQGQRAVQGADLKAGALIAGGGVDRAALGLDALDDVARPHVPSALEHQMLQQVRPAGAGLVLHPRPAAHGDGQGEGPKTGHGVADDADAVGQGVKASGQGAVSLRVMRRRSSTA
ncbi:hypothetical protein D3C80_1075600 [compost metagenome]